MLAQQDTTEGLTDKDAVGVGVCRSRHRLHQADRRVLFKVRQHLKCVQRKVCGRREQQGG